MIVVPNEYDFTSVKLNDFTALALLSNCAKAEPLATFKVNSSFCTNVPTTSLRYPAVLVAAIATNPVAPEVLPTTKSPNDQTSLA